jgi:hypothetical protein
MRIITSLLGFLLFLVGVLGAFMVKNGSLFFVPMIGGQILFLTFGIIGISSLAFGYRTTCAALLAVRFLFFNPAKGIAGEKLTEVLRFMIVSAYAQGGLVFLLSLLNIMAWLSEGMQALGMNIANSIYALMCPILISETLLRPLKARLETLAAKN